jgi:hypothetical protein
MIEDTSKTTSPQDAARILGLARMGVGTGEVEAMEARGQRQFVASADLPTEISGGTQEEFEALGFTFGDPYPHDPLFRPATLPEGWTKQGTDHAMHSKILDPLGRERVGVFYKAAFYDRRADMHLITVFGYVGNLLYHGLPAVLDDEWATKETVTEAARGYVRRERESVDLWKRPDVAARQPEYAAERAAEHTENIARAEAFIAEVNSQ